MCSFRRDAAVGQNIKCLAGFILLYFIFHGLHVGGSLLQMKNTHHQCLSDQTWKARKNQKEGLLSFSTCSIRLRSFSRNFSKLASLLCFRQSCPLGSSADTIVSFVFAGKCINKNRFTKREDSSHAFRVKNWRDEQPVMSACSCPPASEIFGYFFRRGEPQSDCSAHCGVEPQPDFSQPYFRFLGRWSRRSHRHCLREIVQQAETHC